MLRYLLLASAAAVAIPAIGYAQPASSPTRQPAVWVEADQTDGANGAVPMSRSFLQDDQASMSTPDMADDASRSGAGYYSVSMQEPPPPNQDYGAQPPPSPDQPNAYAPAPSPYATQPPPQPQPGYAPAPSPYASQPGPQASSETVPPTPGSLSYEAGQQVVVVAAQPVDTPDYLRRASMNSSYQILAAHIAQRRGQSDAVRQTANNVIQTQAQASINLANAAHQANLDLPAGLDRYHRIMLRKLISAPAASFDRIYLNQQINAQMHAVALQKSYAQMGDNSTMQQAALQNQQLAQNDLNATWNSAGQPERLAQMRDNTNAQLAQAQSDGRTSTFRGYTVFGPTSASQLPASEEEDYTTPAVGGGASNTETGTPQYQGYTQSQPGTATGAPSAYPGYNPGQPGAPTSNPGAATGTPQYQGYTSPQSPAQPYQGPPSQNPNVGAPQYQGYTSPYGATPGQGTQGEDMNAPRPPGYTQPSAPGYMAPPYSPTQPQSMPQQPGSPY
jgi:putative membrane protein